MSPDLVCAKLLILPPASVPVLVGGEVSVAVEHADDAVQVVVNVDGVRKVFRKVKLKVGQIWVTLPGSSLAISLAHPDWAIDQF